MKPNLFTHATSELSQDAFILWLLEWADSECATEDKALHETAKEFVRLLLEDKELEIRSIECKKQEHHILQKTKQEWRNINEKNFISYSYFINFYRMC